MTMHKGDEETEQHRWVGVRPWGRHSLVLLVAGLAYVAIGLAYMFTESTAQRTQSLIVAVDRMPLLGWGCVFVFVGIATMISSRWPPTADHYGYMILTGLSAGWGAFYAMGVIFANTPVANLTGALAWWLIAFMWWAISGLINPVKVIVVDSEVIHRVG